MSEDCDSNVQVHGIQLVAALLCKYITSSSFSCDVLQTVLGTALSRRYGTHAVARVLGSAGVLSQRFMRRVVECVVIAMLMSSRYEMLQDAALLHLLLEYVQKYRFYRLWLTRFLYGAGAFLLPQLLLGGLTEDAFFIRDEVPTNRSTGSPKGYGKNDVLNSLPIGYKESLLFFYNCYDRSVPYAVFASGLVADVTQLIVEQATWAAVFYSSRNKHTSHWRLLKPYICYTTRNAMVTTLVYATRVTGAWVGRRLSHTATNGALFWCERLLLLGAAPFIQYGTGLVTALLQDKLESRYPATAEDELEDRREEEEEAEEEGLPYTYGYRQGNDATNNSGNNNNNEDDNTMGTFASQEVDFYKVLGVQPSASEEEIRQAYRKTALLHHPDRVGHKPEKQEAAKEQMALINQAYEVLSSSSKRGRYDMCRGMETMMTGNSDNRNYFQTSPVAGLLLSFAGVCLTASLILTTEYFITFHNLTGPGRLPLQFISFI